MRTAIIAATAALSALLGAPAYAAVSEDIITLAKRCAPDVHPLTMAYIVAHESRNKRYAIGVNSGTRLKKQPVTRGEALAAIELLERDGANYDLGLAQINSANFESLGLSPADLLDGCTNLKASQTILGGCYSRALKDNAPGQTALRHALSCYNTGSQTAGFKNGYVTKVVALADPTIPALTADGAPAPAPSDPQDDVTAEDEGQPDAFSHADADVFAHSDTEALSAARSTPE